MRALSIRQPFAELILRGVKTIEYRSRPTRILNERFYIYASKRPLATPAGVDGGTADGTREVGLGEGGATTPRGMPGGAGAPRGRGGIFSPDLVAEPPPQWLVELAQQVRVIPPGTVLPTGVIVGSAVIDHVTQGDDGLYQWHLRDVRRAARLRKPTGHPPVNG